MNEFVSFVEYILSHNDSVSIPGIGTFVCQDIESQLCDSENAFLPPRRIVQFIDTIQDSHSNQIYSYIQQIYNVKKNIAEQKLLDWTTDFHQQLQENEVFEFGSFGYFDITDSSSNNYKLVFHSSEAGINAPQYYGLDTLYVPILTKQEGAKILNISQENKKSKHITIQIHQNVVSAVTTIVASLLLLLCFNSTVDNTTVSPNNQAEIFFPSNLNCQYKEHVKEVCEVSPDKEVVITKQEIRQKDTVEVSKQEIYTIVLASNVKKSNAEDYVLRLQRKGYDSARVVEGNITRVVVGQYKTEDEAKDVACKMHRESEEFKYAWVIKL